MNKEHQAEKKEMGTRADFNSRTMIPRTQEESDIAAADAEFACGLMSWAGEGNAPRVTHVRVNVRYGGKRINDRGHAGNTICGAAITDRDIEYRDVAEAHRAGWPICQNCLAKA